MTQKELRERKRLIAKRVPICRTLKLVKEAQAALKGRDLSPEQRDKLRGKLFELKRAMPF